MTTGQGQIERVQEGRRAQILLDNLEGELAEKEKSIINNLKQKFRSDNLSHIELVSNVAQLCSLDDLRNTLKSKISRGNKSAKEL